MVTEKIPLIYITNDRKIRIAALTSRDNAHSLPQNFDFSDAEVFCTEKDLSTLYHPTTQIVPLLDDGRILITDKYKRTKLKREIRGQQYRGADAIYDFAAGGHITENDLSDSDKKNLTVSDDTMRAAAFRELCEELRRRDGIAFSEKELEYICVYAYSDNRNREYTYTYLFRLPGKADDYYVLDDYIGRDGQKHDIELPVFAFSFDELYKMLERQPFCGMAYNIQLGLRAFLEDGKRNLF